MKVFYLSQNKLHLLQNGTDIVISSEAAERYKRNSRGTEMQERWRQTRENGLAFSHNLGAEEEELLHFTYNGLAMAENREAFLYSAAIGECSGIYEKSQPQAAAEAVILNDNRYQISEISCQGDNITASIGQKDSYEKHIGQFSLHSPEITFLTEGDCVDGYPFYARSCPDTLYFTTAGIGRDMYERFVALGPRYISKLSLTSMEQEELYCDEKWDYYKAKDDAAGNLYYIKRPYQAKKPGESLFFTIIAAPFRLLKAIGGALNYFSLRYSGQSLRSGGTNPAKTKEKSERELFIEGNYINAQKELRKNAANEKTPGMIPRSWELWRRSPDGNETCIKKGVYDYDVAPDGKLVFTNGRYLFLKESDESEQVLGKAELASALLLVE